MSEKQIVRQEIEHFPCYYLDCPLSDTISLLENLKDKWCKDYLKLELRIEDEYVCIFGSRLETDKEYNTRLHDEEVIQKHKQQAKQKKEEKDYQEYLRLKKKFENNEAK